MTVRAWALRPTELKPLSRAGLLRLAARCAMRVEPWMPPGAAAPWKQGLDHVAKAANTQPAPAAALARSLQNRGAVACNRLERTDELRGQCANYATLTLATAVEASAHDVGPALKKAVIDAAKYACSIAALHGHAGRVRAPAGQDPVDLACVAMWDAIRADIPVLAAAPDQIAVKAVRSIGPLWPGRLPAWVSRATR